MRSRDVIRKFIGLMALAPALALPRVAAAATDTWDGGGAIGFWSEDANWLDESAPLAADLAVFDDTSLKPSVVDATRYQRYIRYENASGVHTATIPATVTLTVPDTGANGYLSAGYVHAAGLSGGSARIAGGGELSLGASAGSRLGDIYVGYNNYNSASSASGALTIDGVTLSQASSFLQLVYVGYDAQNGAGADTGVLDLRNAILPGDEFKARYMLIGLGDYAAGSLILPSSLKTFTAQASADAYGLICGSSLGATGLIDFDGNGTGAQLETINLTPIGGSYGRFRVFAGAGTTLNGLPDTATWNVGTSTRRMNLEIGYNDLNNAAMNCLGTLDISDGTFNGVYIGNLWVGYNSQANGAVTSTLNLSNATVTAGTNATPDMLDVLDLRVGNGLSAGGTIVLPSALTNLTVRPNADNYGLRVGEGRGAAGAIEFDGGGTGSQLKSITVAPSTANYGTVNLAVSSGRATLGGLSNTVAWTLGSSVQRTDLNVAANYDSSAVNNSAFTLDISQGTLNAVKLGTVRVGYDNQNRTSFETGVVDLAEATVTSGTAATPDMLTVYDLQVGVGVNANGTVILPSALTNLTVTPTIANGYGLHIGSGRGAVGLLDFDGGGTGSQLQSITVAPASSSYYGAVNLAGNSGSATLNGLPDAVAWTVGSSVKYVDFSLAYNNDASAVNDSAFTLDISDGAFNAVSLGTLSVARDGQNRACAETAELDLSRATVSSGTGGSYEADVLAIATALYVGSGRNAQGTLRLPGDATVRVPNAYLAHASYADSSALVTLSNTTLEVATMLDVNPSAAIEIAVGATSSGLDLQSSVAGNFALDAGARVEVSFRDLPADAEQDLWAVRKAGDHVALFQACTNDGRIAASSRVFYDELITVWTDGTNTYLGAKGRTVSTDVPAVVTETPTGVTISSADLNGLVVSTGAAPTTVRVYWATADVGRVTSGWSGSHDFGEGPEGARAFNATGLTSETAYFYRYYSTNAFGEHWGRPVRFVTPAPPTVTTRPPTNVVAVSASLNGELTAGGVAAVRVYWGTADAWPSYDGWLGTHDFGDVEKGPQAIEVTGLTSGQRYVYRYYATNAYGESWGEAVEVAPGVPVVVTLPPSQVQITSAVLDGSLTAGGTATLRVFWGLSDAGPSQTGWAGSHDFGAVGMGLRRYQVQNLTSGQTWFYRFYATSSYGESWGEAVRFTTRVVDWEGDGDLVDYTVPGTHAYVVPAGVDRITAIGIGGGGGGGTGAGGVGWRPGGGGAGGGLRYVTEIPVSPGETLSVTVGTGGSGAPAWQGTGSAGGASFIRRSGTDLLRAGGGGGGTFNYDSPDGRSWGGTGTPLSDTVGGGDGGRGGAVGGGGGAGGYSGNGGAGQGTGQPVATDGMGGGGGGGGGIQFNGGTVGGSGGGVGLGGEASSGLAGAFTGASGTGGSGGEAGASLSGGRFGGGGGGAPLGVTGAEGAAGAVRIIGFKSPTGMIFVVR